MPYDHYPGDRNMYPKGTPSQFPYPKQDFSQFSEGELIAKSSAKDPLNNLIVTSGDITCQNNGGVKDGFTTTYNFRMLLNPMDSNNTRVRYTDYRVTTFGTVERWHPDRPNWSGMHLFLRYQTSDDLYVASYRTDAQLVIKKKVGGKYSTLAIGSMKTAPETGREYVMAFEIEGNNMRFYIDGILQLTAVDSDLTWGTSGVRCDYSDVYFDYIKISDV